MEKEIKEIAKLICPTYGKTNICKCCAFPICIAEVYANKLYEEGYRKIANSDINIESMRRIVYCKDCKFPNKEGLCYKGISGFGYKIIKPDDFCCFGEAIESENADVRSE